MKMTRIVALAIPIAFVLLNFAMPVSAVKPETGEIVEHQEGTYIDCSTVKPEWAFRVDWQAEAQLRYSFRYDQNGDPVTAQFHFEFAGTAWNTASGLTVEDNGQYLESYDFATSTFTLSGYIVHWKIPGQGIVILEMGHIYFYQGPSGEWLVTSHGRPHDLSAAGFWIDYTPMCAVLA